MDETENVVSKGIEAESAYRPPQVENNIPSSYSFPNPMAPVPQNQLPPPTYTPYDLSLPPKAGYAPPNMNPPGYMQGPPVIRTQPLPNSMIFNQNQTADINDYMFWSIFNCLCCCWPFGIIALILSGIVSGKKKEGNVEGARSLSRGTAIWNGMTTLLGIGLNIFLVLHYSQRQT